MNCPRDNSPLEKKEIHHTTVDTCPTCGGMMLAHGQLNQVADSTPGDLEYSTVDLDSAQHADDHGAINCPRDNTAMVKVDFNVDSPIILDYCRTCLGFWIDGGELARINNEVQELNEAGTSVPDPISVRIAQFFWKLPFPLNWSGGRPRPPMARGAAALTRGPKADGGVRRSVPRSAHFFSSTRIRRIVVSPMFSAQCVSGSR